MPTSAPSSAFPGTIYQITSSLQPDIKNKKQLAFFGLAAPSLEVITSLCARAGKAKREQCAPACPSLAERTGAMAIAAWGL